MGNVGFLHFPVEPHCPRCCPACFTQPPFKPRGNLPEIIPVRVPAAAPKSDRLEIGISDRIHPGTVTGFISEC
jgi:hypothetical protein